MNYAWEGLGDRVFRARLPFLDVTVGLVCGSAGTLLIDTGTTLTEARAIAEDVQSITASAVSQVVLTHKHFDHILGSSVFAGADVYCAPQVAVAMSDVEHLRDDALHHGAPADDVERAIDALRVPGHLIQDAMLDLGDRTVPISHPGAGHTDHDLIVVVPDAHTSVVFCGDLVEESGDPVIDADSDPAAWPTTLDRVLQAGGTNARFVPGHGAVVDADFIRRQQRWLREAAG